MTEVIDAILNRSSEPRLIAPAPDQALLEQVFECAARAPDHALLRPWRYLVIEGEGLVRLGELFASTADTEAEKDKLRRMPMRAPMLVVAITSPTEHPKVPEVEQVLSTGAGLAYMLLALQSAGFGGMWRTGALAYDERVKQGLGLQAEESIAGFLYVGSVADSKPSVPRLSVAEFVRSWPNTP